MRHQFSQLTRSAWRFIQRLDDADIGILQVLPKQYKRAVVRRLLSIMPKAFPDGKISVDGVSIHVDGSDISRLQFETTQRDVATYLRHQLVSGMTFVDVGANVGFHTVLAAQIVGPRGHVHSIEPTEETIARLRENLELNQLTNVTVHDCAVGANPGVMTFYVRGGHGAQNSLFSDHLHGQAISSYPVTVRRLDEIVQGPVDVIKIDVEGGELEVLAGMTRILAESPKLCMVLEWCPVMQEKTGHGATQLPETLLAHGFAVDIISPFTAPLRTVDDIQAVLPRVIEQKAHMVDLAAVRS